MANRQPYVPELMNQFDALILAGCKPGTDMHAGIRCDLQSWLGYFDACANGLRDVSPSLLWGGPGSGGASVAEAITAPFLVGMLDHVAKAGNATKLDFIQWHAKVRARRVAMTLDGAGRHVRA